MRNQWYLDETFFYNELVARLEMITRTTPRETERLNIQRWRKHRNVTRQQVVDHVGAVEKIVKETRAATALSLVIDTTRTALLGNHLNLSTKLLKKIQRYHHKENLIALITQQYRFEYWKKNNGEEWQKCSSVILDPAMENQWYTNHNRLYDELVAKYENKPLPQKKKSRRLAAAAAVVQEHTTNDDDGDRTPNILVSKQNKIIVVIKKAWYPPVAATGGRKKKRRTR